MAAVLESKSPVFSPSSDERYWSALRRRIDVLLQNRTPLDPSIPSTQMNSGQREDARWMREDSLLLVRGFDSVSSSLSQLSKNLDNALRGARDLAKPPTMTEIYHTAMVKAESKEEAGDEHKRGLKRRLELDARKCYVGQGGDSLNENEKKSPKEEGGRLKKAKNLAISMATKAASLARELKSMKSDLCSMQERCTFLEEENRILRDGFSEEIDHEEDDLVRLQMEALLAEKSRLANENVNLTRENQCLHQLVEYHQITSQETYEHVMRGMCLDFSSPPPPIPEECADADDGNEVSETGHMDFFGLCTSLDECYDETK